MLIRLKQDEHIELIDVTMILFAAHFGIVSQMIL
jgi:hypothetical protein